MNWLADLTPFIYKSPSRQSGRKQGDNIASVPKSQSRSASLKSNSGEQLEFPHLERPKRLGGILMGRNLYHKEQSQPPI